MNQSTSTTAGYAHSTHLIMFQIFHFVDQAIIILIQYLFGKINVMQPAPVFQVLVKCKGGNAWSRPKGIRLKLSAWQ